MRSFVLLTLLALGFLTACKKENDNAASCGFCNYKTTRTYNSSGLLYNKGDYYFTEHRLDSNISIVYSNSGVILAKGITYYTYPSSNELWIASYDSNGHASSKAKWTLNENGYKVHGVFYDTSGTIVQQTQDIQYDCPDNPCQQCNLKQVATYNGNGNLLQTQQYYFTNHRADSSTIISYNNGNEVSRTHSTYQYTTAHEKWNTSYNSQGYVSAKWKLILDDRGYEVQIFTYDTSGSTIQYRTDISHDCPN